MKVTFCAYDKPDSVGGPVSWLMRLLPALRDHGIEAECLFFLHWGDTGPALRGLQAAGISCFAVPCHEFTEDRVQWVLDRLRESPPDVFVPNLVVAAYFAGRWVREAGIPTVGVLHSDDEFYRGLQDEFVFGRPGYRLSGLACVSEELATQVAVRGPSGTTVRRIPYGVPLPVRSVRRVPETLRMAYVGRFSEEQKRISEVAAAFCRAAREIPGVQGVLYGDGPDRPAVESILSEQAESLPVRLGGRIEPAAMQDELLDCDVIVLLSDYEGLPIALLEAMACGCIPVCLRVRSGIPELVRDGETGLLIDDSGPSFVAAIRRLRTDTALRDRLSNAARASIRDRFSESASAAAWADFLKSFAGSMASAPVPDPQITGLPPVHPGLASADVRRKAAPRPSLYRRVRRMIGMVQRHVSGRAGR